MIQYLHQSFEPTGLYQYKDQTCGGITGACSSNFGNGSFRANRTGDGSIFFIVNFSDMSRLNQCVSAQVTFPNSTTMLNRAGGVARRVQ
jgi:hypothetical protein